MKSRIQESEVRSQKKAAAVRRVARVWLAIVLHVLLAMVLSASAQERVAPPSDVEKDGAELYQSLLDLQNPWTVMCIAAHPDDEDGATLTVLRRKYGVHTVTVFSTYGEGGQNAIGPELYEELGAIRARETIEAAAIQGSEANFLGLPDFGFSKSADEAFRVWGHQEALRRMVLKIRQLRPDVIITNHDTVSGHGHHQATGALVLEAFDAAADSRRFPEQLKNGVSVWQPQRLFVRFQFEGSGSKAAEEEAQRTGKIVSINPNERDTVRGTTYAEQALSALRRHASQGPWPQTLPAGGRPVIRYRLARAAKNAQELPANAQTFLDGLHLSKNLADKLTPTAAQALLPLYDGERSREQVLRALLQLKKAQVFIAKPGAKDEARFKLMSERLQHAIEVASGITMTVALDGEVLVPNRPATFSIVISNQSDKEVQLGKRVILVGPGATPGKDEYVASAPPSIAPKSKVTLSIQRDIPANAAITVPHAEHLYDNLLFGERFNALAKATVDGNSFFIHATTQADVAPAVEITSITPSPLVLTPAVRELPSATTPIAHIGPESSDKFTFRLVNHQNRPFKGEIISGVPVSKMAAGNTEVTLAANEAREVKVQHSGEFVTVTDSVRGVAHPIPNVLTFSVVESGSPAIVTQRRVRVVWADARVAQNLRVGYVRSFDDTLRSALAALGVEAKELKVDDVRAGDLQSYHAIIIDNRGYQAHPELITANSRLMDYVREGGTLIVFYHRTNEWNPDPKVARPQLAPYPITLGNSRVTDETAAIEFSEPQHPLLNYPNKITPEDFAGWIQERGLYYPQSWDSHYSAPLAASDKGEPLLRGGLLAADYGRGRYIYTSMVWYRQLRAGVPGAYRVLANMISYGRH